MLRPRRTLLIGAIVAIAGSVVPATAASAPPQCLDVFVSPAYRQDRTLWCVHRDGEGRRLLAVTGDAGRSWRVPAMAGLLRPAGPSGTLLTLSVSPSYATDKSLFATTGSGTFVSRDRGETFAPVDAMTKALTERNPVPFVGRPSVDPVADNPEPRVLLAYASPQLPALIDPLSGIHMPVMGVPGQGALRFVVPASPAAPAGALAVVNEADPGGASSEHARVFRCDARLTCAEPLFSFPSGIRFGNDSRLAVHPDGSVVAVLASNDGAERVWRSTNGGATFMEWRSVMRLIAPLEAAGTAPRVWFATSPATPRRLYLRVEQSPARGGWPATAPPASQVFRSDDGGASWRRVAYARGVGQRGRRGNLPWLFAGVGGVHLTPDGRVLADGGTDTLNTTWCSLDGGKRWYAGCPR